MYDITSDDYANRVYAGVLGKLIGVYLGRPIEGMLYRDILKQFGPINYYVHAQRKQELIVVDDDISGTFTFARALSDYPAAGRDLTAQQIGQTWLNYIIENKTILWWGGVGLSTEHTAYLRLKSGIPAPRSGSIELNSKVVAEQIGSQIFIDGWAMATPGDPELAADLALKAASVSHDGEAIYGAQVVAVMESLAFVEPDMNRLLDAAVKFIPPDSIVARMIGELRAFHARHPGDWERAMVEVLEASFGYDKYGGNCHMIPNHGVIILALLYGQDDFQRSLMIANTCGWDTDCNAGNVGCLMGIKLGLAGIDAGPDWRGPVADRLYIPTADGGGCVTDALTQAYRLINAGRSLRQQPPLAPKCSARFHFSLPGSVQGFVEEPGVESSGLTDVTNAGGKLAIRFKRLAAGRVARVATATFVPAGSYGGAYGLIASPTISPGQTITATVGCDVENDATVEVALFVRYHGPNDEPVRLVGPKTPLRQNGDAVLEWTVPSTNGLPVFEVGIEIAGENGASGTLYLDRLSWSGAPDVLLGVPRTAGKMANRQWVNALDTFRNVLPHENAESENQVFIAVNNAGRWMAIHGTREWTDYEVTATLTPHLAQAAGLAARVQGLRRYYALLLRHPNKIALVKVCDGEQTLAEAPFAWDWNDDPHTLGLRVRGDSITASADGKTLFDVRDTASPLTSGGIAIVIEEGRTASGAVRVKPIER